METVPNSDDVEYHWIGDAAASMVILFFHADGRSSSDQLIWMHDLHKNLSNSDVHNVAIAVVEYTSTPKDCGILQLQQAAQALNWLVRDLSKKPRNIILMGDSYGGHVVLSLLSHRLHPHPAISDHFVLDTPMAAAVLVSPICSSGSPVGSPKDEYFNPDSADDIWFEGLDWIVRDLVIVAGDRDASIDSIRQAATTLKIAHSEAHLVLEPDVSSDDLPRSCSSETECQHNVRTVTAQWIVQILEKLQR